MITPAEERESYVRQLLADHRKAVRAFRATEDDYAAVQREYDEKRGPGVLADALTRNDVRAVTASAHGAWHRSRADTFALSYLVERDVDERKAKR